MHQLRRLRLTASILLCFVLQALGADKYTDENRPYEFGFKIDGEQHRHESKDKDGIIMGEFGFITADDVYHVTVYATDKEGRFKILSMKNIHLKSSSPSSLGAPTSARQGHALAPPAQTASVRASAVPQEPLKLGVISTPAHLGPFTPQAPVSQGAFATQPGNPSKPVSIEPPGRSCSSCSLPTTTTRAPPPPSYNQVPENNNYKGPNQFGAPGSSPQSQQGFPPSSPGQQNSAQGGISGSSYSPQGGQLNYPSGQQNIPQQGLVAPGGGPSFPPQLGQTAQNYPGSPIYSQVSGSPNLLSPAPHNYGPEGGAFSSAGQTHDGGEIQANLFGGNNNPYRGAAPSGAATTVPHSSNYGQNNIQQAGLSGPNSQPTGQSSYPQRGAGERTAKQFNSPEQQFDSKLGPQGPGAAQGGQRGSDKPTLFSAQMQIVDKNTDVYALGPNEQKGLPPGLTQSDMTQLLYTFNYTVGFHGHFEEGYTNGVKKGYYFVTGRNGVRTRIDYVADDTGFHPKVSQEVLDLLSEDVPKPETEKDEKYGLKGYEFKWLYYPVESKKP